MVSRDSCQIWVSARRTGEEHLATSKKIAKRIVSPVTNGAIAFKRVGTDLFLASYYDKVLQITNNLDISGQLPIRYQDPNSSNDGIAYVRGLDFYQEDNLVALVSQSRQLVRIYDRAIGEAPLAQIGEFNSKGNVADNKLNDPRDCLFLPNGNLLVVSRNGQGVGGTGAGHVSEYDQTGALVATRLKYKADGQSAIENDIVNQPTKIKFDPNESNYLWVSELQGRLLKVNTTSWLVEDMIFGYQELSLNNLESFCFLSDGTIAIASLDVEGIVIIEPKTKELVKTLDPIAIGGTREVRDVIELEPGYLGITCWSSRGIDRGAYILPTSDTVKVSYEPVSIPENYEVARDRLPWFYNPENSSSSVPLECLHLVQDELAIPLRKIC